MSYVINYGNHPTTPTELPEYFRSMTQAKLGYNTMVKKFKRVTLHRLNFGADGLVTRTELLKSKGTPVEGFTKVRIPVAKLWFSEDNCHFCWSCEHSTLGLRGLGDTSTEATQEFINALKLEAGSSDLPLELKEYEGEFFCRSRIKESK